MLGLAVLVIENEPLVGKQQVSPVSPQSIARVKYQIKRTFVRRANPKIKVRYRPTDLVNISQVANHAFKPIRVSVELLADSLQILGTLPLPGEFAYLNIDCRLIAVSPERKAKLDHCKIGRLPLPEGPSHWLVNIAGMLMFGKDVSEAKMHLLSQTRLYPEVMTVAQMSRHEIKMLLINGEESPLSFLSDNKQLQTAELIPYFEQIELVRSLSKGVLVSLDRYTNAVFRLAEKRSLNGDPQRENRAAFWALVLGVAEYRFSTLVGIPVMPIKTYQNVTLAGRRDLALHFLYSAAIQALTQDQVSFGVGEMKELLDSRHGGSGFSFQDLAADRAGIQFAKFVLSPDTAEVAQKRLSAQHREIAYFQSDASLQEGLDEKTFAQQYDDVESEIYSALISAMDSQIDSFPLYLSWQ